MTTKPHIGVLIPVHCSPDVLKLTIGSLLAVKDDSYDVSIIICIHENYNDYSNRGKELLDIQYAVSMATVKEIDWYALQSNYVMSTMRYSLMHAKSLAVLLNEASLKSFSHVLILDHDLKFKGDFIAQALQAGTDVFGCMFTDKCGFTSVRLDNGTDCLFAPKLSVYNLFLSRKAFDYIMSDITMIAPAYENGIVMDTFARAYLNMQNEGLSFTLKKESELMELVEHIGSMSFNWGERQYTTKFPQRVKEVEQEYHNLFPNGIHDLLKKVIK